MVCWTKGYRSCSLTRMADRSPTICGLSAAEMSELAKRAMREAVRADLRAGIAVTGLVDGEIRTLEPSDPLALEMLKDGDRGGAVK